MLKTPENLQLAEQLSFMQRRPLTEHRPLGSMNCAGRVINEEVSESRHKASNSRRSEPTAIPE
jgi:hypothetical protein